MTLHVAALPLVAAGLFLLAAAADPPIPTCSPGNCGNCTLPDKKCYCVLHASPCLCAEQIDCENVCGGHQLITCMGCDNVTRSGLDYDKCGVCNGTTTDISRCPHSSSSPVPTPRPKSSSSSSSSSSQGALGYYARFGKSAFLYAVVPLSLIVGGMVVLYLRFKCLQEGVPRWLDCFAALRCCWCLRGRGRGGARSAPARGVAGGARSDAGDYSTVIDMDSIEDEAREAVPRPAEPRREEAVPAAAAGLPATGPATWDAKGWGDEDVDGDWGPKPGSASTQPKNLK